jgi:diguanylate cyclase (GGDEF)-like protein
LEREKNIARTDDLTGTANRRSFFETAGLEIERSKRYPHPYTVAYIDLDELKTVNDRFGHRVGDEVLCAMVDRIHSELRKTDVLARLGGDEFALLLPETGQEAARVAISKIQSSLADEMRKNNWAVTFSIGVITCLQASITTDELVKRADAAMYAVKKNGKNGVLYSVYAG